MNALEKDPWNALRKYTNARIALGSAGGSMNTNAALQFRLDHALAKVAVLKESDKDHLIGEIEEMGEWSISLKSQADNREVYLQRPDLGKRLAESSKKKLLEVRNKGFDIGIVIADGLSAWAVDRQALPFLKELIPQISQLSKSPIVLVEQGRVAIGDEIGELLKCKLVIVMVGERPGLSSPDSLGIYITYDPKMGTTDERRNCISNIHPNGLGFQEAAKKLAYLCEEALRRKLTGVQLKDNLIASGGDVKEIG